MYIQTSEQEKAALGFGGYQCNWGLHLAGLYETEQERDNIIFGFLKQGFKDGDLQLYCPTERSQEDFISKFSDFCPDCTPMLHDPAHCRLLSMKDLYYPEGVFSPTTMDEGLNRFFESSQQKGFRPIRATAEMVWALEAIPGIEHLMVYESRLNYFIPGKPWISICLYNINKFSGATIMDVLRTHPFSVTGTGINQNPYYMDPDDWLAEYAPDFLMTP